MFSLLLLAGTFAVTNAVTFPSGVQTSITEDYLRSSGCTNFFNQPYSHGTGEGDIISPCANCDTTFIGCRQPNSVYTVGGFIQRNILETKTNSESSAVSTNGLFYYNYGSSSVGISDSSSVTLNSADTAGGSNRLSWHIHVGGSTGGYRCGSTTSLNSDSTWRKELWSCNSAPTTTTSTTTTTTTTSMTTTTPYECPLFEFSCTENTFVINLNETCLLAEYPAYQITDFFLNGPTDAETPIVGPSSCIFTSNHLDVPTTDCQTVLDEQTATDAFFHNNSIQAIHNPNDPIRRITHFKLDISCETAANLTRKADESFDVEEEDRTADGKDEEQDITDKFNLAIMANGVEIRDKLTLGQIISLDLSIDDGYFGVLDRCWATPTTSPNHPTSYTINEYALADIFDTKMTFPVFRFEAFTTIGYHCDIIVCPDADCQSPNRKRRSTTNEIVVDTRKFDVKMGDLEIQVHDGVIFPRSDSGSSAIFASISLLLISIGFGI